jgi:hypothetical protein
VKWSAVTIALVPLGVVTVTSTMPVLAAGETAVIDVEELTVNVAALAAPAVSRNALCGRYSLGLRHAGANRGRRIVR